MTTATMTPAEYADYQRRGGRDLSVVRHRIETPSGPVAVPRAVGEAKQAKAKRRKNPLSRVCDELFLMRYRGRPCEVCASQGKLNTDRTTGHHIVAKSRSRHLRYEPRNIVVVCQRHHTFGGDLCFHGFNGTAVANAIHWLEQNRKADFEWCLDQQHIHSTESWAQSLEKIRRA